MIALPPGFRLMKGAVGVPAVEDAIASLAWEQPKIRVYGREHLTPRLVSWMGEGSYAYAGQRHEPAPMPAWIFMVRAFVQMQTGAHFNSVLANLYRDGRDSVAYHADDEPELGERPTIASVTIGAARAFVIKSRATGERWTVQLGHGDLLVMSGCSQADYLHAIPKTARPVGPRMNLTFRSVLV